MHSLKVLVTDNERIVIGNELEKLFAVHDKPLKTSTKAILVQELTESGIPVRALTAGIRALMKDEELRSIKLATILEESRRFLEPSHEVTACQSCNQHGVVMVRDAAKYQYVLACICANGERQKRIHGLVTWNGRAAQESRGRLLTLDSGFEPIFT